MTDYLNPLVVSIDTISQPSSIYFTMEINPNMYVRKGETIQEYNSRDRTTYIYFDGTKQPDKLSLKDELKYILFSNAADIFETIILPHIRYQKYNRNIYYRGRPNGTGDNDRTIEIKYYDGDRYNQPSLSIYFITNTVEMSRQMSDSYKKFIVDTFQNQIRKYFSNRAEPFKGISKVTENKAKFTALKSSQGFKNLDHTYSPVKTIGQMSGIVPNVKGVDVGQGRKSRKTRKHRSRKVKKTRKH